MLLERYREEGFTVRRWEVRERSEGEEGDEGESCPCRRCWVMKERDLGND